LLPFLKEEQGLTMVEYAIAGGLIVAIGTAVFRLWVRMFISDQFTRG